MSTLLPKKPFYVQHEFQASLSKDDLTVPGLQVVIEYPEHRPSKIKGSVLGSQSEFDKLCTLMDKPGPYCTLDSTPYKDSQEKIKSSKVLIRNVRSKSWPQEYASQMADIVGELELDEITVTHNRSEEKMSKRQVVFALAGATTFWPCFYSTTYSFTGEVDIDVRGKSLDVGNLFEGSVEIRPWFFHSTLTNEGREVQARDLAYALVLESTQSTEELSDDELFDIVQQLADDLTLLASFVSRKRIRWFNYKFSGTNCIISYTRSTDDYYADTVYREDMLVQRSQARDFLRTTIHRLNYLRNNGMDLFLPIVNVLTGHESKYLEQKFILYFIALEKLKDMYADEHNLNEIFKSKCQGNKFLTQIRATIRDTIDDPHVKDQIMAKVRELQRPPLRNLINRLFKDYSVSWEDLYPHSQKNYTFTDTRNKLIHRAAQVDIDTLFRETYRVRSLVERLILRMLEWDDLYGAPDPSFLQYLSSKS